jgi:hypothetical protein
MKVTKILENERHSWCSKILDSKLVCNSNVDDMKYAGTLYEARLCGSVEGIKHKPHSYPPATAVCRVYL